MRAVWRIMWLWPGLTRLWLHGDWTGLALAATFAAAVNMALFANMVRPDLVPASIGVATWAVVLGIWAIGLVQFVRGGSNRSVPGNPNSPQDLFLRAQEEYLKGNWPETESIAKELIRDNPHDAESHLLLASVFRRTGRADLAHRFLRLTERIDENQKWLAEIQCERALLDRSLRSSD